VLVDEAGAAQSRHMRRRKRLCETALVVVETKFSGIILGTRGGDNVCVKVRGNENVYVCKSVYAKPRW
jgi:hypothetical protein